MARDRIPNFIARKTNWIAILNFWFFLFLTVEIALGAFYLICSLGVVDLDLPTIATVSSIEINLLTVALAAWSLLYLIAMIWTLIIIRCQYIEFYDTYVIERKGVIFRKSKKSVFPQVLAVTTQRNIFGYGSVNIDVVGPWDVELTMIKRPEAVRDYLIDYMVNSAAVDNISSNPYIAALGGSIF